MVNLGMHSGKGPLSHEAKEAAFMKLFHGVGADSAVMASKNSFSKPADFSAMPSAPPTVEDVPAAQQAHRPDPKLADDNEPWVPHNIHAAKHAGAGAQLDAREAAFVKLFDRPVKQYAQAAAVDVDMAKLPDHYEAEDWSSSVAKAEARGIDELRDRNVNVASEPREQWKPKNMSKKMSKRGEEMHEGFLKIFENEPVRTA